MKIEDVFGDYQNGNFNTNTNTNINQNKKTKLEDTLGYKSVNNGNDNYNPYAKGKKNGSSKTGVLVVFLIIAVMIVLIALYLTTDFLKTPIFYYFSIKFCICLILADAPNTFAVNKKQRNYGCKSF